MNQVGITGQINKPVKIPYIDKLTNLLKILTNLSMNGI